MLRSAAWGTLALSAAVLIVAPRAAEAQSESCKEFRQSIVRMERESPRPPGWLNLDAYLRIVYDSYCVKDPTPDLPTEYWYRADGTSTGVPARGGNRPADGAYATTKEIGDFCLRQAGDLIRDGFGRSVRAGMDPSICALLHAGTQAKPAAVPAEPLPPFPVALDGGPYTLPPPCLGVLNQVGNDAALGVDRPGQRAGWRAILQANCPDLLAGIERRTGARADRDPARFWPALGQLLLSGFSPGGPSAMSPAAVAADPGFQRMCREAEANMNTCALNQANMRSVDTAPLGTTGQAGAFNQCRILYGQVAGMCQSTTGRAVQVAATPPPLVAPRSAPSAASRSQPQQQPQQQAAGQPMSPKCQQLISGYIAAARAGDGAKSVAAHNALKQAGGCDVLDKVAPLQQPPPAGDSRFESRGATPHLDASAAACDRNPAGCAAAVNQLRQGTSPEAVAALYGNAISIGLQLGAMAGQGLLMMQPQNVQSGTGQGGGSNMNSIGPGPVRGTYGQGAPAQPQGLPANRSTITGTTR